jgi:1,4-alpha-glucan branching enzyme
LAPKGKYKMILNSDNKLFGGFDLIDEKIEHITLSEPKDISGKEWLKLYIPARTAFVLKKM